MQNGKICVSLQELTPLTIVCTVKVTLACFLYGQRCMYDVGACLCLQTLCIFWEMDWCSDAGVILDWCGEEGAEPEGQALNSLVDLCYNPHLWSWALGNEWWMRSWNGFFSVQGDRLTLRDRARNSDIQRKLRVEALALHVQRSQVRLFGHVIRMPTGCLLLEIFQASQTERRPWGTGGDYTHIPTDLWTSVGAERCGWGKKSLGYHTCIVFLFLRYVLKEQKKAFMFGALSDSNIKLQESPYMLLNEQLNIWGKMLTCFLSNTEMYRWMSISCLCVKCRAGLRLA